MAGVGSITVPVNLDPIVTIDTISLNDGDVLVLHVPAPVDQALADAIHDKAQRLSKHLGKRVAMIVLPEGHSLDRLSAERVRDLWQRLQAQAGGEG